MIRKENGNIQRCSKESLGMLKKLIKSLIGNKTWEKFKGQERGKIQNSRSERLKQRSREEYIMRRIAK